MTKTDRRIKDFTSGINKLSNGSKSYIHKLSHILLLIEKIPVNPIIEKKEKDVCMLC